MGGRTALPPLATDSSNAWRASSTSRPEGMEGSKVGRGGDCWGQIGDDVADDDVAIQQH